MPQSTGTVVSLADVLGTLDIGHGVRNAFGGFASSHSHGRLLISAESTSQTKVLSKETIDDYRLRRAEAHTRIAVAGSIVLLLIIVVVLAWLLFKKSNGQKNLQGAGIAPDPRRAPGESYDLKDKEIDRKDMEIERKEMELEHKEKELDLERDKRQKDASKFEADRRNLERELDGAKEELKKLRDQYDELRRELESQHSKHQAEMRLVREEYDAKSASVRQRFEEQLSEFETSQKHFWPEVFREAGSLGAFCGCVKESFTEGSNTAAALYAELVSLGSRLDDMQAFVNQISPVGRALYAWINETGRTGDGFDLLLAQWLTEKVSRVDLKVVAVQPGEAYNNSIHDCSNLGGNSVSKVLSFLILGKSNRTELKAIVEVG